MKKFFQNRMVLNTIILFIYTTLIEMIIRIFTNASMSDFAVVRICMSSFIIASIVSYITHFMPKLVARIIDIIYVIAVTITCFLEFGLYNYLGFFMGAGNADQGTKVLSYISDYFNSFNWYHFLIFIPMILFILYYIIIDRKIMKNVHRNNYMTFAQKAYIEFVTAVGIALICLTYYGLIKDNVYQNALQTESNYAIWLYPENSNLSVNNYGVLMYLYSDTKAKVFNITLEDVLNLTEDEYGSSTNKVTDPTREIDDTAWNELIANTTDSTYSTLNSYFINREITEKNDYTGIFEGKNLILILMESTNDIAILNEEDFPTLNKLYNEGISFRNNFSPRNNCSTGNNEFTVLTSLFTINDTCTANTYKDNEYFEAAFNLFKKKGYYSTSYHDFNQKYYFRKTIHANLGSSKFYSADDLGMNYNSTTYGEWPSDVELFKAAKQYYMGEDTFFTYFATVTPHQTYNISSEMGDKYLEEFEAKGYSTMLARYLSKMKTLDEALAELLDELESEGKLEDTVIALFGDHYPYGLKDSQINEYLTANGASYTVNKEKKSENMDIDRTPMIIYNSEMEPLVVEDYTTIIDLLPTLLNMFNIDYDPRLYLGTDIFSSSHVSRAVFSDGSWQDANAYYYAPSSKITYYTSDFEYTVDELKKINKEITTRQKMSSLAITSNYFKYLGDGLEQYATTSSKESSKDED